MEQKYLVALEIGSSHIRAAIGTVDEQGVLSILAKEYLFVADVTRYGWIQNADDVGSRIGNLFKLICNHGNITPRKVKSVYVGIGGRSMSATPAVVERHFDDDVEITPRLYRELMEEASNGILSDRKVVDVQPREFLIDNRVVSKVHGALGRDIRAEFSVVSCSPQMERNLRKAITEKQAIPIKGMFVRQIAMADLVLTPDEKNLGCMLVDFGAETIGVSIYKNDTLRYMVTLPIGSRCITRDVMTLGFTEERAEGIKKSIGDAINVDPNCRRADFDGDPREVNDYIRARAGELAVNIAEQTKYAGMSFSTDLPAGIVLVGAGAKLHGFSELLAQHSGTKVRLGTMPSSIRVQDTTLQSVDMLDVIAILYAAASSNPEECMELPEPVRLTYEVESPDSDDPESEYGDGWRPKERGWRRNKKEKKPKEEKPRKVESADENKEPKNGSNITQKIFNFFDQMFVEDEDRENNKE